MKTYRGRKEQALELIEQGVDHPAAIADTLEISIDHARDACYRLEREGLIVKVPWRYEIKR